LIIIEIKNIRTNKFKIFYHQYNLEGNKLINRGFIG
jgi:hypothetical protein